MGLGMLALKTGGACAGVDTKKIAMDKWPWPYVKLDPEKTAEIAYGEWYRVYCGAAVVGSIFGQLKE